MIPNEALDRLVQQDTFAEMLDLLEPEELVTAVLRLEGLTDTEIGRVLDISAKAIRRRLELARQRIISNIRELAPVLKGRHCRSSRETRYWPPALDRGWLGRWGAGEEDPLPELFPAFSVAEVARHYGVSTHTVRRWLRAGRFPRAYRIVRGRHQEYRIPDSDIEPL